MYRTSKITNNLLARIILHIFYLILIITGIYKKRPISDFIESKKKEKGIQKIVVKDNKTVKSVDISVPRYKRIKKSPEHIIIIDDDVGMFKDAIWKYGHYAIPWLKITDPDGGLELIYGLRDPNTQVLGVTIIMGVASTDVCVQAAKNILNILNIKDVPVLRGARTPKDLGVETEAARFIVNTVMDNPGQVEIIATGPLTNIATAIMIEPELPKYWHTLHFATGEFRSALGEISDLYYPSLLGIPDLNINVDINATRYVLEHGEAFPIYPNEIMDDIILTRKDYNRIKNAGTKIGNYIAYELKIHDFIFGIFGGMIPHGVVPIALALDPSYKCKTIESAIVMKNYGSQGYAFVLSNNPKLNKHKIYLRINEADKGRIHQKLIERLI
ncbi:MAG: nucleoside hydrolase [Candidatus Hodarchaeota archaeon]